MKNYAPIKKSTYFSTKFNIRKKKLMLVTLYLKNIRNIAVTTDTKEQ